MNEYDITIKTIQDFFGKTREEAIVWFDIYNRNAAEFYNNIYEENN